MIPNLIWSLVFIFAAATIEASPIAKQESEWNGSEAGLGPKIRGIENDFLKSITGFSNEPVSGRFVYTGENGQLFEVFYFADAYGYQAQGRLIDSMNPLAESIKRWT